MPHATSHRRPTVLAAGRFLQLVREGHWEFAERRNATGVVAIIAITDAGELVLTEQFRKPINAKVIDLPAGLAGDEAATESLTAAARRELLEETGFKAQRIARVASAPTSPGLTSEIVTFFRAAGLRRAGSGGGAGDEMIRTHCIKLTSVARWLQRRARSGVTIDLKVYAGLYFARLELQRSARS